jgi:hypothetical protein
MLTCADFDASLLEIYAHAIAARPCPEFACSFKVIHAWEMHDAERHPGNLDAAASYDFGGNCAGYLLRPPPSHLFAPDGSSVANDTISV